MKKKMINKSRLFILFLGIYLSLLFAVIIPFHHHADNSFHNDCAICVVAQQAYISSTNSFVEAALVFILILVSIGIAVKTSLRENLHLRSPPVF